MVDERDERDEAKGQRYADAPNQCMARERYCRKGMGRRGSHRPVSLPVFQAPTPV